MEYNKFAPGSPARCAFRQPCVKFIITPVFAEFIATCHICFLAGMIDKCRFVLRRVDCPFILKQADGLSPHLPLRGTFPRGGRRYCCAVLPCRPRAYLFGRYGAIAPMPRNGDCELCAYKFVKNIDSFPLA